MRHLRSLLYALVLAPTIWTLSAVGFTQNLTGRARGDGTIEVLSGFLLLLLAGAAYAILLLPRLSPTGPAAAGALYLTVCIWVLNSPGSFHDLFSPAVTKPGFDLTLPANGLAALLAVPLLCTTLSRRRWRENRYEPLDATTGPIVWPFSRPTRPGTLVVPGVSDLPTPDATQVLPSTTRPATATATQVLPTQPAPAQPAPAPSSTGSTPGSPASTTLAVASPASATSATASPVSAASAARELEGDRTQVIRTEANRTQLIPKLPSPAPAGGDVTQIVPSLADVTRAQPSQPPARKPDTASVSGIATSATHDPDKTEDQDPGREIMAGSSPARPNTESTTRIDAPGTGTPGTGTPGTGALKSGSSSAYAPRADAAGTNGTGPGGPIAPDEGTETQVLRPDASASAAEEPAADKTQLITDQNAPLPDSAPPNQPPADK